MKKQGEKEEKIQSPKMQPKQPRNLSDHTEGLSELTAFEWLQTHQFFRSYSRSPFSRGGLQKQLYNTSQQRQLHLSTAKL